MKTEEILAICALLVAVVAAYYSYKSTIATRAAAISSRFDLILQWACDCIHTMLALKSTIQKYHEDQELNCISYNELLVRLSFLIEKGRFIFPNINHDYGENKVKSRQGLRPVILDFLVFAYAEAEKMNADSPHKIDAYEQLFQSDIWEHLKDNGYYLGVDLLLKVKPIDLSWEEYIQSDLPNATLLNKTLFQ